jgi:arylformamidase
MVDEYWIDISVPLYTGMAHWPDNPPVRIERMLDQEKGDAATVSKLSLGAHTGTHMDAPVHFLPHGEGIDTLPLAAMIGPTRVIAITDDESIKRHELEQHAIRRDERVLFKTQNSVRCWQTEAFVEDFVYIAAEAALYLAEVGVRTVGVDYLSVGGFTRDGEPTHRALLSANVCIIEGLNLSQVEPGQYELICLPLKIRGADGAPARAVLRALR